MLSNIMKLYKKNNQVSNLVDRYDYKAFINFSLNIFKPLSISTFLSLIMAININVVFRSKDKNVKKLTKIM